MSFNRLNNNASNFNGIDVINGWYYTEYTVGVNVEKSKLVTT